MFFMTRAWWGPSVIRQLALTVQSLLNSYLKTRLGKLILKRFHEINRIWFYQKVFTIGIGKNVMTVCWRLLSMDQCLFTQKMRWKLSTTWRMKDIVWTNSYRMTQKKGRSVRNSWQVNNPWIWSSNLKQGQLLLIWYFPQRIRNSSYDHLVQPHDWGFSRYLSFLVWSMPRGIAVIPISSMGFSLSINILMALNNIDKFLLFVWIISSPLFSSKRKVFRAVIQEITFTVGKWQEL